ncbi:hypothetical protein AMJ85_04770 [candidate division BRC1 bacterium SM23_51]|nr:MAG: hypothetical protein AMJ85_04770 [candidate division BRC1 bacterium SM23_51]
MIDPIIERRYSDCRELMNLWRRYHDYFKIGVAGDGITPEREHEFITVKSRIAMLHDSFMESLEHDQNIGQNVLDIVKRSITLKHIHRMSTAEIKKIELEWHESYLLLNETVGMLEDKRKQFALVKPSQYYRQIYTEKALRASRDFLTGWVFKAIVAVVVLMVLIFAFIQFGAMDWLSRQPMTKRLVLRFEDLIRVVAKDYPFRTLDGLRRLDPLAPSFLSFGDMQAHKQKKYAKKVGIGRVAAAMRGSRHDFSTDLEQAPDDDFSIRCEIYNPGFQWGGTECVLWLFRLPNTRMAKAVETKYTSWLADQRQGAQIEWLAFRKANVIGVVFGGDRGGQARSWVRDQYMHVRRKG